MVYRKKQYRKWHLGHLIRRHRHSLSECSKVGGPRVCLTWYVQETCVNLTKFMLNNMLKVVHVDPRGRGSSERCRVPLAVSQMCFSMFMHTRLCFSFLQMPSRCRNALNIVVTTLFAAVVLFTILLAYVTGYKF